MLYLWVHQTHMCMQSKCLVSNPVPSPALSPHLSHVRESLKVYKLHMCVYSVHVHIFSQVYTNIVFPLGSPFYRVRNCLSGGTWVVGGHSVRIGTSVEPNQCVLRPVLSMICWRLISSQPISSYNLFLMKEDSWEIISPRILFSMGWLIPFGSKFLFVFSALNCTVHFSPWSAHCRQTQLSWPRLDTRRCGPVQSNVLLWAAQGSVIERKTLASLSHKRFIGWMLAIFYTFKIWQLNRNGLSSGDSSQKLLKPLFWGRTSGINPLHPPSIFAPFVSQFLGESFWLA